MSAATLFSFIIVLFLGFSFLHGFPLHVFSSDVGFSAKLFHRDSLESPFHDPNSTLFSRNRAAILRSVAHKKHHTPPNSNFDNNISTILTLGDKFEYIMLIEIGTPPMSIYGLVDSASDLMWILCSPCKNCYEHKGPIFEPKDSSTYVFHPCHSDECSMLEHTPCHGSHPHCKYKYEYADNSYVKGILSNETLSFDINPGTGTGKFKVPGIVFGCTHNTKGYFNHHTTGIVGLGAASISLVRQLSSYGGNKFSYCLPSTANRATRIYFGSAAVVSSPNVVSTPLFITDPPESLYNIELDRIHVTNGTTTTIILPRSPRIPHEVRFLVDSGIAITFISPEMMSDLSNTPQEVAQFVDICFHSKPTQEMPLIKFEFMGGAMVVLKTSNVFMLVNPNTICLAISSNANFGGESVFGSRAQSTTRLGYDLDARRLSFLPEDC